MSDRISHNRYPRSQKGDAGADPREIARARARMQRDVQVKRKRRIMAVLLLATGAAAVFAFYIVLRQNNIATLEEAQRSTALMRMNGEFTLLSVEDFSEEQYDEKELVRTVDETLASYNGEQEQIIEKGISFEEGKARLILHYKTDEDYESFNRTPMFYGKMSECLESGYDLSSILSSVSRKNSSKIFSKADFEALGDLMIVYFAEPVDIHIPDRKKILFTTPNLRVVSDTEADAAGTVDKEHPAIIIME